MMHNDELHFLDENQPTHSLLKEQLAQPWKILIVDDEKEVHQITKLILQDFTFEGQQIETFSAFSGDEARQFLTQNPDTALVLLDVVMESDHAGLETASFIRTKLQNHLTRIVLRTGQPGQAPERQVITDYDINDYKEKTELTAGKFYTTVISSLRNYRDLQFIESHRQGLLEIVQATRDIMQPRNLAEMLDCTQQHLQSLLNTLLPNNCWQLTDEETNASVPSGYHFKLNLTHAQSKYFNLTTQHDLDDSNRALIEVFLKNMETAIIEHLLSEEVEAEQKAKVVMLQNILQRLNHVIGLRSKETVNHVNRVAAYSYHLAIKSGWDVKKAEMLKLVSPMHDIGKVGIPDSILMKPGKLNDEEYRKMQTHAQIGYDLLNDDQSDLLKLAAEVAGFHHEKWDGTGYPNGLKGDQIPIAGQLTAICDVYDALSSKRCYKAAWTETEVIAEMKRLSGSHFNPALLGIFLEDLNALRQIAKNFPD